MAHKITTRRTPKVQADQLEERESRVEEMVQRAKQGLDKASEAIADAKRIGERVERSPD